MTDVQRVEVERRGREWFAGRIRKAWQSTVEGIFEVGRLLIEAKASLPHGEFGDMVKTDLPFAWGTANRLMTVAQDDRLSNSAHARNLPPGWETYETGPRWPNFARRCRTTSVQAFPNHRPHPGRRSAYVESLAAERRETIRGCVGIGGVQTKAPGALPGEVSNRRSA